MNEISVELVFALPEKQLLLSTSVPAGTVVHELLQVEELRQSFPDYSVTGLAVGIWGCEVAGDRVLKDGDRVEIYRPLELDPREARRQLALVGKTMSGAETD